MGLKIYIVIGYDSILDSEEIKSVWFNELEAEKYKKKHNYFRVEEHEIADSPPMIIELLGNKEN